MRISNNIYIIFIRSNTKSGENIRKITGWNYSHISISFDENLSKFYAFSKIRYNSFLAGFTEEYKSNYTFLKNVPAEVTIYKIPISKKEQKIIINFITEIKNDSEYIFNYPSMLTTKWLHGFLMYKSYNCITFVSKILTFISRVSLSKKYYKYDLVELEKDLKEFYYKKESFIVNNVEEGNTYFDKTNYFSRKKDEIKLLHECIYRLIFKRASKLYNKDRYTKKIKNDSQKTFDFYSKNYDKSFLWKNPRKNYSLIINKVKLKRDDYIIDVGCGTGYILNNLADNFPNAQFFGLDISSNMLEIAKMKKNKDKIKYVLGDAEKMPFDDSYFDILITSESFHHYPNPEKVLQEFRRVLKRNGTIILCDMYRPIGIRNVYNFLFRFSNTGDVKIYSRKKIIKLLTHSGFSIIKYEKFWTSFIVEAKNEKD